MTESDSALREKVRKILTNRCQISIDSKNSDQNIHLDSTALMRLAIGLKNEFNITLDTDKLGDSYRSQSLNSITRLVSQQAAARKDKKFWNGEC